MQRQLLDGGGAVCGAKMAARSDPRRSVEKAGGQRAARVVPSWPLLLIAQTVQALDVRPVDSPRCMREGGRTGDRLTNEKGGGT